MPLYFAAVVSVFFLLSFFFFLTYAQRPQTGCLPYFHIWCGLSANLECRSGMCCTRLAEIQDAKISQKSPSAHHRTILGYDIRKQGEYRQSEKSLLNSIISSTCPHNMVNFGSLTPWLASLRYSSKFQQVSHIRFVIFAI